MHDTKERLSLLWIFALLNYLYADVLALWALLGKPPAETPHLGQLALAGSAVLMEIPMAMIVACRFLPLRANRLANIIAGSIVTLVNGFLTGISGEVCPFVPSDSLTPPPHVAPNIISVDDDGDTSQDERCGPHEIEVDPRPTHNVNRGALVDHEGQHGRDE